MMIREIQTDDVEQFIQHLSTLDRESQFMLFEPGEQNQSVIDQKNQLQRLQDSSNRAILIAWGGNRIIGHIAIMGGFCSRNKHSANIIIGVEDSHRGKGFGKELLIKAEDWSRKNNIKRLELTVMTHNFVAFNLYKKMGFEIEGIRKRSLLVDEQFVDEYYMSKQL